MNPSFEELKQSLRRKNIRLSFHRIKVLEYFAAHPGHPSAEEIFTDLHSEIPTLSKTTVYNTLKLLTEAGILRTLEIEGHETRFDIETEEHGHFLCGECSSIHNFPVDVNALPGARLPGFIITERNVYFKGICPQCLTKSVKK